MVTNPDHAAEIDGGVPASYMGMPEMRADHLTLVLDGAERRIAGDALRRARSG